MKHRRHRASSHRPSARRASRRSRRVTILLSRSRRRPARRASGFPEWFKYLPKLRFNEFDESPAFQLLPEDELNAMLATCTPEATQSILEDLNVLDKEVLRLFRRLDYEAARQQNRYRRSQRCTRCWRSPRRLSAR
ncbi:MAG: hypothetical protein HND48_19130 [Chloroflexi bacterium]|nr:hypothetical protein [Chloroflexota bacterium]